MLELKNIQSGYGKKQVLFDISMNVEKGEIVSVIGPNGSGKSTILKVICGALRAWDGELSFKGRSVKNNPISKNIASGISIAPQGNRVFNDLTVKDNLELGGFFLKKDILNNRINEIYKLFPVLKDRSSQIAGKLSGGEQQMLAVARALIPEPELLLLDEPSLGLAPNLLDDVFDKLKEINKKLGITIIIVEQKVNKVLEISERTYSIKLGRLAFVGKSSELIGNKEKLKELFL